MLGSTDLGFACLFTTPRYPDDGDDAKTVLSAGNLGPLPYPLLDRQRRKKNRKTKSTKTQKHKNTGKSTHACRHFSNGHGFLDLHFEGVL